MSPDVTMPDSTVADDLSSESTYWKCRRTTTALLAIGAGGAQCLHLRGQSVIGYGESGDDEVSVRCIEAGSSLTVDPAPALGNAEIADTITLGWRLDFTSSVAGWTVCDVVVDGAFSDDGLTDELRTRMFDLANAIQADLAEGIEYSDVSGGSTIDPTVVSAVMDELEAATAAWNGVPVDLTDAGFATGWQCSNGTVTASMIALANVGDIQVLGYATPADAAATIVGQAKLAQDTANGPVICTLSDGSATFELTSGTAIESTLAGQQVFDIALETAEGPSAYRGSACGRFLIQAGPAGGVGSPTLEEVLTAVC
jgi:hypothetical protein